MASINGAGPKSAAARLRELLARKDKLILCPGVYDGLTARLALREGFECLYMVFNPFMQSSLVLLTQHDTRRGQDQQPHD